MEIRDRVRLGVTILEPIGPVTIGGGADALRGALHRALDAGAERILIDLGSVPMIDSSGIGSIIASHRTVTSRGGELKLLHLPPKVHDVLQITLVLSLLEVHDDEESAIASFGAAPDQPGGAGGPGLG